MNPKDDLEKQIQETQAKLEQEEKEETPQPSEPAPSEENPEPSEPAPSEPAPSEPAPSEPNPEKKEEIKTPSTEERYKESTREAQRLYKNNVAMNKAIEEGNSLPEPTDDELKAAFPEWEDMSATERVLSRESLINKRFREVIAKATDEQRSIDKWEERVDKYVDDPKTLVDHPELEGKTKAFTEFVVADKKLVGHDFAILVSAFLHDYEKNKPAPKKGQMFETGSGGAKEKQQPKSDKLSPDEADKLMKTDYNKWKQMLKDGKLEQNIA